MTYSKGKEKSKKVFTGQKMGGKRISSSPEFLAELERVERQNAGLYGRRKRRRRKRK